MTELGSDGGDCSSSPRSLRKFLKADSHGGGGDDEGGVDGSGGPPWRKLGSGLFCASRLVEIWKGKIKQKEQLGKVFNALALKDV
jgi:hypothetical protein